ncbi:MAG: chromosomal replication initiator protein DnaA [bacterium]|nr:chromosomal replication initiator protein DnaA [bacterium]
MTYGQPQPLPSQWDSFKQVVQDELSVGAWQTWIAPLRADRSATALTLEAPSEFHRSWVRDRYLAALRRATISIYGADVEVLLEVAAEPPPAQPLVADVATPVPTRPPEQPRLPMNGESRLVSKYTFDNFVVGPSNRFANAAAMAVAEQPGSQYNPLFIYADAGLGKTHLLHAVGHHRRELAPSAVVRYVTSEQFFNEFINGIRRKRMDEFKARYRTIDVLLLDDVQFFDGKEQILEEFFHTFNSLYEAGKQLVITSDRHPKHLSTLEDRLRSRFEWGLLTDIQTPDVETRLAILRSNAEFAPTPVPKEVLNFIAESVMTNIRELEGALTRVTAYAALTHEEITLEMSQEVLRDLMATADTKPLTSDDIINRVASFSSNSRDDLVGPSRRQPLARYRQIAMYLCREYTDLSLPKIGKAFGGRDHTTVLHAVEKIKSLMQADADVFSDVTTLSHDLRTT